jgi:molybdopterin/thiamine biosynthesis adenylyltransferase
VLRRTAGAHGIQCRDSLAAQLAELARVRFPASKHDDQRAAFVEAARGDGPDGYAGIWIYFPWRRTIVRGLEPDDHFSVVTDRNRQKITLEEQRALRTCAIGVVGLSVGGEIAFTLAQEHLCGRLVLADFDTLDLSNLNRLSAGLGDLGVNKAVLLARRVAELDPWLIVDVYPQGLTEANAGAILDGLDLLVEECDDLPMKVRVRELAIERGVDVVYGADEGGFLSVEPYSRPDVEIFHGRVPSPPVTQGEVSDPVTTWKRLAPWLGGWNVISQRSRDSVEAIGTTLNGYPQLASEPRQAASQVAHVARRLLLGESIGPLLVRHDLQTLIDTAWGALGTPPQRSP